MSARPGAPAELGVPEAFRAQDPPEVLLVDDHAGFRAEVRALLELEGLTVVGEAADGRNGVAEATRLAPDVIILDIGLPDADGLDLVVQLQRVAPGAAVILVSGRTEAEYGGRVARSGADGFIDKAAMGLGFVAMALARGRRP